MTALDIAGIAVFLVGVACLFVAQSHDILARANRAEGASPVSFLIRPLHLFDADLYTPKGNRHRETAVRYLGMMIVSVLVSFVLFVS